MKLQTYYDYSDQCINSIVYTMDNTAYFQNNITLTTGTDEWEGPIMNMSRLIAGNGTNVVFYCEQFGMSFYTYSVNKFALFDNSIFNYSLSFLFNQMGNALVFQNIFKEI